MERKNIKKQYRYIELDILRGLAIVMMIIYHFLFDLEYLGKLPAISLYTGFWKGFQISTAGLFLFLVGVSLTLSYNKRLKKFLKNREYSIRHAERRMTEGSLSSNIVLRDPSVVSTLAQDDGNEVFLIS